MDSLKERVAMLVEGYQWDSATCEVEARQIADAILAIPEIAEAQAKIAELEFQLDLARGDLLDRD